MTPYSDDEIVELLIAYWQGAGPTDLKKRNTCRRLAGRILQSLPANRSEAVCQDPLSHVTEIQDALTDLSSDPIVRAYISSLSQARQSADQSVSVVGDHHQVITAGRDIRGLTIQILPEPLEKDMKGQTSLEPVNILAIFANPKGTNPLRLGAEDRVIRECLRRSKGRDCLHLDVLHAATIHDVRRALLDQEYRIVHFSGHGTGQGLMLEDELGQVRPVPQDALAEFLSAYSPPIECVLLNACYSEVQGQKLSKGVPYTIAMQTAISDEGAAEFTRGFYDAIGAGKSIEFAYQEGCRTIKLMGLPGGDIPVLFKKPE